MCPYIFYIKRNFQIRLKSIRKEVKNKEMKKLLLTLGFLFYAIEILSAVIYGLTFVPWGSVFTEKIMIIVFMIVWNIAGGLFLWLGYKEE